MGFSLVLFMSGGVFLFNKYNYGRLPNLKATFLAANFVSNALLLASFRQPVFLKLL